MSPSAFGARLADWRRRLVVERANRLSPHLDDKVLTDWNGYVIGTFARAGAVLGDERYPQSSLQLPQSSTMRTS